MVAKCHLRRSGFSQFEVVPQTGSVLHQITPWGSQFLVAWQAITVIAKVSVIANERSESVSMMQFDRPTLMLNLKMANKLMVPRFPRCTLIQHHKGVLDMQDFVNILHFDFFFSQTAHPELTSPCPRLLRSQRSDRVSFSRRNIPAVREIPYLAFPVWFFIYLFILLLRTHKQLQYITFTIHYNKF